MDERDKNEAAQDAADDVVDQAATENGVETGAETGAREDLGIDENDRLPWLETADDYDDNDGASPGRIAAMVLGGLLLLALVVGGIYWAQQRQKTGGDGDGALIAAQEGDYKVKPEDPQGKQFEGEGDTAYGASQGKQSEGRIMAPSSKDAPPPPAKDGKDAPGKDGKAATTSAGASASASASATAPVPAGAALVQLGAFSDTAKAEAEWKRLSGRHSQLSGLQRKITTGSVEGRTVYRLAAVTANPAAANTLCGALKSAGASCLVVR